jgi:hypothetical protein
MGPRGRRERSMAVATILLALGGVEVWRDDGRAVMGSPGR